MLGFDLFDRVKGRLVPTEEAKMLFKQTQDVFAAFANTRWMVGEIQGNRRASLTLAKIIRCQRNRLATVEANQIKHASSHIGLPGRTLFRRATAAQAGRTIDAAPTTD